MPISPSNHNMLLNAVMPGEPHLGAEYWFPESVPIIPKKSGQLNGLHSANDTLHNLSATVVHPKYTVTIAKKAEIVQSINNISSSAKECNATSSKAEKFNKKIEILKSFTDYRSHRTAQGPIRINRTYKACVNYIRDNNVRDAETLKIIHDFSKKYSLYSNKRARNSEKKMERMEKYRKSNEEYFSIYINMLKQPASGEITQEQKYAYEKCGEYIKITGIKPNPDQKALYDNFSLLLQK